MTNDELALKIFEEMHGNKKPGLFGFRKRGRGLRNYTWDTDFYEYTIEILCHHTALLTAVYRTTGHTSMIRRFFYNGSRLDNVSCQSRLEAWTIA